MYSCVAEHLFQLPKINRYREAYLEKNLRLAL